jgi:hypothetical protein
LEVCGLGDCFDASESDNYWIEPTEEPVAQTYELLGNLISSGQVSEVNFNLDLEWFSNYLTKDSQNTQTAVPLDYKLPFDKFSKNGSNKRAFCIDLHSTMSQIGMKFTQINKLFEVFQRHQSSLNLPVVDKNPLLKKKKKISIKNNIRDYVGQDNGTIVIDVCRKDCIAFHGIQLIKGKLVDCSKEIICPICFSHRYSHCKSCPDLEYGQCNPFVLCQEVNTRDGMGHKYRIPEKTLFYRPITTKLLNLYKLSLLPGNEGLLNYFQDKYRVTRPGIVCSVLSFRCSYDFRINRSYH